MDKNYYFYQSHLETHELLLGPLKYPQRAPFSHILIRHVGIYPTSDVPKTPGQTFCDLHTHLHLFYRIFHSIRINNCDFFSSIQCHFRHILSYTFLQTYVRISPSDMNDFSLRDLHTLYLPPYVSIMFRTSVL